MRKFIGDQIKKRMGLKLYQKDFPEILGRVITFFFSITPFTDPISPAKVISPNLPDFNHGQQEHVKKKP
jgi:hypothetical protein